jgi:hypothetical protein
VLAALRGLPDVSHASLFENTARARTAFSSKTFGEQLSAEINEVDDEIHVTVSSRPRIDTMEDWGKNYLNVALLLRELNANFETRVIESDDSPLADLIDSANS